MNARTLSHFETEGINKYVNIDWMCNVDAWIDLYLYIVGDCDGKCD